MQKPFPRLEIPAATFLYLAALLLVLPIRWVAGAMTAAFVHEAGHLCALKLLRVPIYGMKIGISGAVIETGPMGDAQELFCAISGPAAGVLTILAARHFPVVALCGILQSLYNIVPIYPSDGARLLECLVPMRHAEKVRSSVSTLCLLVITLFALYLMRYKMLGIAPMFIPVFLAARFGLLKNTLQRLQEHCTIDPL